MLLKPSVWKSQPPAAAGLNPSHWLTPLVMGGSLANPSRDPCTFKRRTTSSAGTEAVPGGVADKLTGSAGCISTPTVLNSGGWTTISYGVLRAANASAIGTVAQYPGASTYDRSLWLGTDQIPRAYLYSSAAYTVTATPAVSLWKPTFVAAYATSSEFGVFVNGQLATISVPGSGYTGYAAQEFVIGYGGGQSGVSGGSSTLSSDWSSFYTLHLTKSLTLAQLIDLEKNPWAIFAPRRVVLPMNVIAGGSLPRPSSATYVPGSITSTGFRPRVTAS